ncbi:hypothetical protein [Williamsia sp. 1138]|uniref:hypothetical protein n=1 Tax=Williamsia sp. 1138 TaxID=1903117 RepID=UPI00117FFB95|nr:hypothetical protein [Williamsia sp. 1138]
MESVEASQGLRHVDGAVVALVSVTPVITWAGGVVPAADAVLYILATIVSIAALLLIQVRVGLRVQDGAGIGVVIVLITGVAAWAVTMVLTLLQSPIAIPSLIAAILLLSRALCEPLATDRRESDGRVLGDGS